MTILSSCAHHRRPAPRLGGSHHGGGALLWLRPSGPTRALGRVPISAKVVADTMVGVGVDRVLTVDLHAEQIQGFFTVPVDNVYASSILNADIVRCDYENLIVVSPDIGGVVRARAIAKQLDDADLAIIDKRRPRANEAEVMNLIGDVEGRTAILVDDMVDTAGTYALRPTRSKSVAR